LTRELANLVCRTSESVTQKEIELKRKTDEQINPVYGLETRDQSDRQKQTKVEDKIF